MLPPTENTRPRWLRRPTAGALTFVLGLGVPLSWGCSGTERPPPNPDATVSTGTALGGAPSRGVSRKTYPEGPYGVDNPEVGDVVENLAFYGYLQPENGGLATEGDFGSTTMQDIRLSGKQLLVLHVASFWCASCQNAAADLAERSFELESRGAAVVELVIDGTAQGVEPSREELELWVEVTGSVANTVGPGDEQTRRVFPEREHAYIIDLQTMEVLWHEEGLYTDPTVAEEAAELALGSLLD